LLKIAIAAALLLVKSRSYWSGIKKRFKEDLSLGKIKRTSSKSS
jgi:hypothetical protein